MSGWTSFNKGRRCTRLNRLLAASGAPWKRDNSLQIESFGETARVKTIQYLEDQAARAERLAKRITDAMTVEKLLTFACDRRREIAAIAGKGRQA